MLFCPYCNTEFLEGADVCEGCELPITDEFVSFSRSTLEADLLRDKVNELTTRPHDCVPPDMTVAEVLKRMVASSVGCVTVVDEEGQLAGIFSERDAVLRINTAAGEYADQPISKFMTPNPTVIEEDAKIAYALHLMDMGGYRHLPVLDEAGQPVKMISIRDILDYLTEHSRLASA